MKASQQALRIFKLSAICFSTWMVMGYITPVNAAVVVDPQKSPATSVTIAGTGATIVNISGANTDGVSHNNFTQFDVDPTGVILNNGAGNSVTTLGGNIAGNSNMAGGSASVILNEVNSRNPSQLNGMIEVAGQQAAVVIANPSGITCDGCGFINASRSTLVTGTAEMSNGKLTGFNVNKGKVVITGKGMNDQGTGYTDIISRSVQINAQLQAQDLRIVTGSNNVNYDTLATRKINSVAFSGKPSLALDVSSLGGMYANKIQLIGTENGVGVRNNGTINANDTLSLNNAGRLENNGLIQADAMDINTQGNTLDNDHGTLQAQHSLNINSGNIDNNVDGAIVSNGTINIDTHGQSLDNGNKGISGDGPVTITIGVLNNNGWIASNSTLNINSSNVVTNNGSLYGQDVSVTAKKVVNNGLVQSNNSLLVNAADFYNNDNGVLDAQGDLNLQNQNVTNSGKMSAKNANIYAAKKFDNNYGEISTTASLLLNTQTLTNTGGQFNGGDALQIIANKLDNSTKWYNSTSGGNITAADVNIKVDSLVNNYGAISGNTITLLGNDIDIANGTVIANGDLDITAQDDFYVDNKGTVGSDNGNVTIKAADDLSNDGIIYSENNVSLTGADISNDRSIVANDSLSITASNTLVNNQNGYIYGGNSFTISAVNSIDNAGEIYTENRGSMRAKTINLKKTSLVHGYITDFYFNSMTNKGLIYGAYTYNKY